MSRSLVLLHGFAQTPASWLETIAELPADLKTAAPELPGHGETALSLGAPAPELARSVAVEAVRSAGPPAVVWGYSQGVRIAFDLALAEPSLVSALVLESGQPGIADPLARADRRSRDEALARGLEKGTIEDFVALWERLPALGNPSREQIEAQREDRLRHDPKALAAVLRGLGQSAYEPMWDRLGEITVPVLLITGERDAVYGAHAERMRELLPDARHVRIPEAGHSVHVPYPAPAAAAVRDFLAELS